MRESRNATCRRNQECNIPSEPVHISAAAADSSQMLHHVILNDRGWSTSTMILTVLWREAAMVLRDIRLEPRLSIHVPRPMVALGLWKDAAIGSICTVPALAHVVGQPWPRTRQRGLQAKAWASQASHREKSSRKCVLAVVQLVMMLLPLRRGQCCRWSAVVVPCQTLRCAAPKLPAVLGRCGLCQCDGRGHVCEREISDMDMSYVDLHSVPYL